MDDTKDAIFISYRRAESEGQAGRLFDRLRHWFDDGVVFFDVDGIGSGDSFPPRIIQALDTTKTFLAVISPGWLESLNARVGESDIDYVRREVTVALRRIAAGDAVVELPGFGGHLR